MRRRYDSRGVTCGPYGPGRDVLSAVADRMMAALEPLNDRTIRARLSVGENVRLSPAAASEVAAFDAAYQAARENMTEENVVACEAAATAAIAARDGAQ